MTSDLSSFLKKNWFWIALVLVVFAGYQFGKDYAMAMNQKEIISDNE